jgi:PST family polysaccharide transporter
LEAIVKRDFLRTPDETARVAGAGRTLRLMGGCVGALGLLLWSLLAPPHNEARSLVLILATTMFTPALLVSELWLHAHLEGRRAMPRQWLALIAGALARISAVLFDAGLTTFAVIAAAEVALAALVAAGVAHRRGLRHGTADRATMRRLAREAWPLLLSGVAVVIYMRIDILMIARLAGDEAAGIYAGAVRFSELTYFIPVALAASTLPGLLRAQSAGAAHYRVKLQQYFDFSAVVAYLTAAPLALLAPWLVHLAYGSAYAGAATILMVHAWGTVFVFLGVARSQFLVNAGLTRFSLVATIAGAVCNILLNLALIPRYGGVGAAVATVISFGLSAWLTSFLYHGTRTIGWVQTRALLAPITGWRYLRKT